MGEPKTWVVRAGDKGEVASLGRIDEERAATRSESSAFTSSAARLEPIAGRSQSDCLLLLSVE
jgi:hypothetical protein